MNEILKPNFDKLTCHNFFKLILKIHILVYLKFHSNDLEGVRVMEPINIQCKSIHRRTVDTNLVKILAEMSELLGKKVYVLNKCFKYKFRDSCRGHTSPRKVCDEKERKK